MKMHQLNTDLFTK